MKSFFMECNSNNQFAHKWNAIGDNYCDKKNIDIDFGNIISVKLSKKKKQV